MPIAEISILPRSTGDIGVSGYLAKCVQIARQSGLECQLTPMGTILHGELDAILKVAKEMHEAPFASGALRVYTILKIDDRRDGKEHTPEGKVQSVEEKM